MLDAIAKAPNPAARYIARYPQDRYYLWDELAAAAWLDPTIITKQRLVYMDVDLSHGLSYGDTITWTERLKPDTDAQLVHAQIGLDLPKFKRTFIDLMSAPTPHTSFTEFHRAVRGVCGSGPQFMGAVPDCIYPGKRGEF